jgi:hypothetical protein
MKRTCLMLLLSLAAMSALARGADDKAEASPEVQVQEDAREAAPVDGTEVILTNTPAKAKSNCVQETGSRIKRRDARGCNGEPGRSYDRDDLDRTGAIDAADALRRLDPSIGR